MLGNTRRFKNDPPPGFKRVGDWAGKTVRLRRDVANGWGRAPAGTIATVESCGGGVGLTLVSKACGCCGLRMTISRIASSDVELVEETGTEGGQS